MRLRYCRYVSAHVLLCSVLFWSVGWSTLLSVAQVSCLVDVFFGRSSVGRCLLIVAVTLSSSSSWCMHVGMFAFLHVVGWKLYGRKIWNTAVDWFVVGAWEAERQCRARCGGTCVVGEKVILLLVYVEVQFFGVGIVCACCDLRVVKSRSPLRKHTHTYAARRPFVL